MFDSTDELTIGIDVSHYNPPNAFNYELASAEIGFCMIRVAYGCETLDEFADEHTLGFAGNHVPIGYYLFALMHQDPDATAACLVARAKALGWTAQRNLPLFLDVEQPPANTQARLLHDALTPEQREAWLERCLTQCDALSERITGIYSGPGYWNSSVASTKFADRPYWAARYPSNAQDPALTSVLQRQPSPTTGWGEDFNIWQFTARGKVNGYDGHLDKNAIRRRDLESRLIGASKRQ